MEEQPVVIAKGSHAQLSEIQTLLRTQGIASEMLRPPAGESSG